MTGLQQLARLWWLRLRIAWQCIKVWFLELRLRSQ